MSKGDRRVAALRRFAEHVADVAPVDLSVRLWEGTQLPLSPEANGSLVLSIATPAALTRLVRRPRLPTLVELIADGAVDLEGGTLLDLAARAGSGSTRALAKRLDKGLAFRTFLPFFFGSGGGREAHAYAGVKAAKFGRGRDDKAQVQFHYDVSNAFYALFLDPELVYSCAYFPDSEADIAAAQKAKLDMSCRKLRLRPGERLLDIGCGWAGFVCHAVQHYGVRAHGVTLSQAQYDFAREKVARLGLQDSVLVELRDFRDLSGMEFDKVASIGMYEHVGLDNRNDYFRHIGSLLKPRGIYLHHAIARPMKATERKFRRANPEFRTLVKYIFPGGELDHIGGTLDAMERNGFEIHDTEGWREHYGRTCRLWTERLYANREAAYREVGTAKTKIWLMYLAACALAFERGTVGIFQTVATKKARGASGLPPTRRDLYA